MAHPTSPDTATKARAPVRALDRGLSLLEVLAAGASTSLRDLARAADLPVSTCHRLLETLVARGFAQQDAATGRYVVGGRAYAVGARYLRRDLHEAAHPAMAALRDAIDESVNLAVRDGEHAVYVAQVEAHRAVRMFTRVGARVPLHASGVGKALLAWMSADEREVVIPLLPLPARTAATFTTRAALVDDLHATRARGYALDLEEYEVGVRCVSVPVHDAKGVVAALSASGPVARFSDAQFTAVAERLRAAARVVSGRLGWVGG